MKSRVFPLVDRKPRYSVYTAAARVFTAVLAAAFFSISCYAADMCASSAAEEVQRCSEDLESESPKTQEHLQGILVLEDPGDNTRYAEYEVSVGDGFSVGFVHSVNKSPVTDYFEIREDGIYGVKTVYYGFGAGVPTDLEEGQTLTYGEDGSMIITGYEMKMSNLIYRVGTVSDHILTLQDGTEISLRDLCGRSARVCLRFEPE